MSAPPRLQAAAARVLDDLAEHRQEEFGLRLDRWWEDLLDGLQGVYEPAAADGLAAALVASAARAYRDRDPELLRLDRRRTLEPDWFQSPRMLGYAAYTDRFAGRLADVGDRIPYLRELGVTYLHLMPLLQPRPGESDGGYAVRDYRSVRADLGDMDDLRTLARDLRAAGISLVLDLVLNHVAREHPWAVAARAGDERYRRYFRIFPDRSGPDAFEATLPEVFPDFAPGSFSWDAELDAWVWTTFHAYQWDVDWSRPDVFAEYADIVLFLANAGVEVLRLDAIAFLWKRLGTDCQNQPEVHAITQALRALVRIACPATVFKAEAIVGPAQLAHYLGHGAHHGKVSDLAYHNSLMVQIWSMLASRDVRLAAQALRALPPVPSTTAWVTYVRCHDDIGWAISDEDCAAVGLSGAAHRAFLSDYYAGSYPGSPARGLVFQFNEQTGDRRISGTAASLAGLESDEPSDLGIARLRLAHALILGWGGIPVLWMGDEIGVVNDPRWAEEPGHEGDNRWTHRPRMPWGRADQRDAASPPVARLFAAVRELAAARASLPQLHAGLAAQVLDLADPGVLPVLRAHPAGPMLALYNVTDTWRPWPAARVVASGLDGAVDAITGERLSVSDDGNVWLGPYDVRWFVVPTRPSRA